MQSHTEAVQAEGLSAEGSSCDAKLAVSLLLVNAAAAASAEQEVRCESAV